MDRASLLRPMTLLSSLLIGCGSSGDSKPVDGDLPPHSLTDLPAEFPLAFSVVRGVMALPDGRLVVSDPQENVLAIIDFEKGTRQPLGRIGEGPGEFRRIGGLYRAPGGGVWVLDQELRRLVLVSATGTFQDIVSLPSGGAAGAWSVHAPDPISVDTIGNAYAAIRFGDLTAPSSVLLRFEAGAQPDTVAFLRRPRVRRLTIASGLEYQEVLFSPEDSWAVSPEGRIAIVRAEPYRVEWLSRTQPTVLGPVIGHTARPIEHAEKEAIASGTRGRRGRMTVAMGMVPIGGAQTAASDVVEPMPVAQLLFAEEKPAVNTREGNWPLLDNSGLVWVPRNVPAGENGAVYDVFDRLGNLANRVALPAGSRLVGVDARWIFTVRRGSDDLEYLQRFPLPQ